MIIVYNRNVYGCVWQQLIKKYDDDDYDDDDCSYATDQKSRRSSHFNNWNQGDIVTYEYMTDQHLFMWIILPLIIKMSYIRCFTSKKTRSSWYGPIWHMSDRFWSTIRLYGRLVQNVTMTLL